MSNKHKGPVLTFKDKQYPVLKEFSVMHIGWESDNKGWIIDDNGTNKIILTSHGDKYEASKKELQDIVTEYQSVLNDSITALDLLPEDKKTNKKKM